jgi:hypothetical protein
VLSDIRIEKMPIYMAYIYMPIYRLWCLGGTFFSVLTDVKPFFLEENLKTKKNIALKMTKKKVAAR